MRIEGELRKNFINQKGKQCGKKNRNREDPSEHDTTDDEGNIDEKVIKR